MKVFVTIAVLCLMQAIAGQVIKDNHKEQQQNQGDQPKDPEPHAQVHGSGHQSQALHSNQNANKEQQHVAIQNQPVAQHVPEHPKPTVKVQQSSDNSKVSVEIPPKVQQIVTQVSQQIPHVEVQHVANKDRVVRSVKNRMAWQTMQVNAIEQPGKCEFICNQVDVSVCGYNGRCYWEFESQCDLSTYNCLNTQQIFHIVDFAKCQDAGAAKCYRGDL